MIVPVTLDAMPADGGLEALTSAAEAGEPWAMVELGLRYSGKVHQHYYVTIDAAEGLRWIQKAVEAGSNLGLILLGEYYYSGRGGAVDNAEALRLLEQARLKGLSLGPERWQADEVSVIIGELYFNGLYGVQKNRTKALDYFRAASDNGHVRAMNFLATMYENGEVVNKDVGKALELYQISAEAGNADSQYNIGIMIYNGVLRSRDLTAARQWIQLAAENGNDKAMFALGVMMEGGEGGPRNAAQAYDWYRKAAALGNNDAAKKLQ
jgi:TPR repeat protein